MVSSNAHAGDSGLYYDKDRDGDGIILTRNGNLVQFYLYTYDPYQGCWGINIPDGGLVTNGNCHENRWFLSSGDTLDEEKQEVSGFLYTAVGLNYPKGMPDPNDPFRVVVGEGHIVGLYILKREEDGWRLAVVRFGEILDKGDPMFGNVFELTEPLLKGTD